MKIREHELSPFPGLLSTTQTRLTFTAAELKTLERAAKILEQADRKATHYYMDDVAEVCGSQGQISNPSLSDLNMDMALMFCTGYLRDILEHKSGLNL